MKRRFIKVSSDGNYIWAVADDGTAWYKMFSYERWQQLPPLPDRAPTQDREPTPDELRRDYERDR